MEAVHSPKSPALRISSGAARTSAVSIGDGDFTTSTKRRAPEGDEARTIRKKRKAERQLPKGKADSLNGITFVVTGTLDLMTRKECEELIKECGGRVVRAVSGKVTHGIVGRKPGGKLAEMEARGIALVDEGGFLDMIAEE